MAVPFYEAMGFKRVGCVAQHAKTSDSEETVGGDHAAKVYRLRKRLRKLLRDLSNTDFNRVFQEPVDTTLVTDYLALVKKPMDFGTMRRKLVAGDYGSLAALVSDFDLVWANCLTYLAPESFFLVSRVYLCARRFL